MQLCSLDKVDFIKKHTKFNYSNITISEDANVLAVFESAKNNKHKTNIQIYRKIGESYLREDTIYSSLLENNCYFNSNIKLSSDGNTLTVFIHYTDKPHSSLVRYLYKDNLWLLQRINNYYLPTGEILDNSLSVNYDGSNIYFIFIDNFSKHILNSVKIINSSTNIREFSFTEGCSVDIGLRYSSTIKEIVSINYSHNNLDVLITCRLMNGDIELTKYIDLFNYSTNRYVDIFNYEKSHYPYLCNGISVSCNSDLSRIHINYLYKIFVDLFTSPKSKIVTPINHSNVFMHSKISKDKNLFTLELWEPIEKNDNRTIFISYYDSNKEQSLYKQVTTNLYIDNFTKIIISEDLKTLILHNKKNIEIYNIPF